MKPLRRRALLTSLVLTLGCGGDAGADTDTDGVSMPSSPTSGSSESVGPPDTLPDDDDSLTDSDPSSPSSTSDSDPSTPTTSDSASESADATDTGLGTDDATGTDDGTGTGTGTDTDTDTDTDPTGDPLPDGGACCDIQAATPGCEEEAVEACVCAQDEFCCINGWDAACVAAVVSYGCGICEEVGGEGDCCTANGTPGCDDDAVEACVCAVDSVCCLEVWDETCVEGVELEECGTCPA